MPVGGIIAWPRDSNPSTSSNIWLECNGEAFDTNRFPKLYKVLGSNKTPNYQGVFLRGAGSQTFSQDNGQFTSSSTTYSSGSIGVIQGDSMRRLHAKTGVIQYGENDGFDGGNFMKIAGASLFGMPEYELGGRWGTRHYYNFLPYMKYTLSGDAESGYSLSSSVETFDFTTATSLWLDNIDISPGLGGFSLGWDSAWGAPTANEIRPVNVAVKYYIRAK